MDIDIVCKSIFSHTHSNIIQQLLHIYTMYHIFRTFFQKKCVLLSEYHLELQSECSGGEYLKTMCVFWSGAFYREKNMAVLLNSELLLLSLYKADK